MRFLVPAAVLVLAAAGTILAAGNFGNGGAILRESWLEAMAECGNDTACLTKVATGIGREHGWQEANDALEAYENNSDEIISGHVVAHAMGLGSHLDLMGMGELNLSPRDIGFIHGWTEWYLTTRPEDFLEAYTRICDSEKNLGLGEDCGHGFGHAVYQQKHGGLGDRVAQCKSLLEVAKDPLVAVGQCMGGLVMSYGEPAPRLDGDPPLVATIDEVEQVCNELEKSAGARCWPYVVLFYYGKPGLVQKYAATCEASSDPYWCGDGLGSYAVYENDFSDLAAMRTCLALQDTSARMQLVKAGCVAEVIMDDLARTWRETGEGGRTFPCEQVEDVGGTCSRIRRELGVRDCFEDQNSERVELCRRNRRELARTARGQGG